MSDREMIDKAKSRGRRDRMRGVRLENNPMRGMASRHAWAEAWKAEDEEKTLRQRAIENANAIRAGSVEA